MVRLAIVNYDKCKPTKCKFECGRVCPSNLNGKKCITVGDIEDLYPNTNVAINKKAIIAPALCTGCNMCVKKCPFDAISIINLPQELETEKILYSYGENSFRIYKTPSIKKGHAIGLLGGNGLGKTTILRMLSNRLHYSEKDKMFAGSEMQKYMSDLNANNLSIAYKVQELNDYIISVGKTTVNDLLDIILPQYIEVLQLNKLRDRLFTQLSGGELQRILIAETLSKNTNVYIFDEPSAFLDIKQRILTSNLIIDKCTDDKYLLCVEHDLCILDYICDFICCLYGQANKYSVITSISSNRNAINNYLDGYFRTENLRFRENPITFNKYIIDDQQTNNTVVYTYNAFTIKYDNFNLSVEAGSIHQNEIILLVGENGTGKTSFVKHIANNSNIICSVKVQNPYIKVQNITPIKGCTFTECCTVRDYLEKYINSKFGDAYFINNVINVFGINQMLDMELSTLSGGQMQKLSIAVCLGKDADLYLLDEPSAFIDIEDRCSLSKMIKQFAYHYKKQIFVVEHDITLATNIANKVILFTGEPAVNCQASQPINLTDGINQFLKILNVTMRKDNVTGRPSINKLGSQKDVEQRHSNNYYIID